MIRKRLFCLLLTLTMLAGTVPAVFAETAGTKPYRQYTVLGDSIPAGYGPYNYEYKGYARIPCSYPALVAERVAADWVPLARTGFRTTELRYMLEDDYAGDDYLFRIGKTSPEDIHAHRPEYRSSIASSDLITLQIGSNDILNYGMVRAVDAAADPAVTAAIREFMDRTGDITGALSLLLRLAGTAEMIPAVVGGFVLGMQEGFQTFCTNWEAILGDLRALAPDADLVVLGMYNPLKTTKLTDASLITIGRAFDGITASMNLFMRRGSAWSGDYLFVDTADTEIYDLPSFTDGMYMDMLLGMVHPTRAGHRDIANRVLQALPVESEPVPEPESFSMTPNEVNVTEHSAYVSGYEDGTFRPGRTATRAETASMLCSLLLDPSVSDGSEAPVFSDIRGHWAQRQITTLAERGLLRGYRDGSFRPDGLITRGEVCAVLTALYDDFSAGPCSFTDISGHWAEPYVRKAQKLGITDGFADGTFRPDAFVTRAQLVTMINGALGRDPDEKSVEYFEDAVSFPDVAAGSWYYHEVMEAANSHSFRINKDVEMWTGLL